MYFKLYLLIMIFIKTGGTGANQNNGNNLDRTGTNVLDNNNNTNVSTNDQATVPNVNQPELTTASDGGGKNGIMLDVDLRIGGSNDNMTNLEPMN